jgi:hypothetical protein
MATMPLQQGQQRHCNDGKDACASMMMMTPLQQRWLCQLEDGNNAVADQGQQCHFYKGNKASSTTARMRLRIDNGNNAIVMRVTIAL